MISSIVGVVQLDLGCIDVFGEPPRHNNARIGYMPQEPALFTEFTFREILKFYGVLFGLTLEKINERTRFLAVLLEIPDENRLIREFSGGQQRRVSFAVTLMHEPEIMILDEPTVGLDPLLRVKIWEHLKELTTRANVTVLLSTHYFEEASQSDRVGLMRNGVLVAEDSPRNIMRATGTESIEETFLLLSKRQQGAYDNKSFLAGESSGVMENHEMQATTSIAPVRAEPEKFPTVQIATKRKRSTVKIINALLIKNMLQLLREFK